MENLSLKFPAVASPSRVRLSDGDLQRTVKLIGKLRDHVVEHYSTHKLCRGVDARELRKLVQVLIVILAQHFPQGGAGIAYVNHPVTVPDKFIALEFTIHGVRRPVQLIVAVLLPSTRHMTKGKLQLVITSEQRRPSSVLVGQTNRNQIR